MHRLGYVVGDLDRRLVNLLLRLALVVLDIAYERMD